MDANHINLILDAFTNVMPQLGLNNIEKKSMSLRDKIIKSDGVGIVISIIGDIKGNIIYLLSEEDAKNIASIMMMGMPVEVLDEMSKSAVSELINMLTANAATNFANNGIGIDISPPMLMHGDVIVSTNVEKVLSLKMGIENMLMEVNIALEDSVA